MAKSAKPKKAPARASQPKGEAPGTGAWREVVGIVLIGIGLLLTYFVAFDTTSSMGKAISGVLRGLAGVLHYLIPALLVWVGVLVAFSSRRQKVNPLNAALVVLLVLCVCAGVHVFVFDRIVGEIRTFYTFFNFVTQSYAFSRGGAGVLGAILSWPLYHSLGAGLVGSMILLVMIVVSDLVLLRKISLRKLGQRVQEKVEGYREQRAQTRAERMSVRDIPPANERGRGKRNKAELDELEMWPETKVAPAPEPQQQRPARAGSAEAEREMAIPKFSPAEPVLSKRRSAAASRPMEPVVAEQPDEAADEVPDFLVKGPRKQPRDGDAGELHVKEPKPLFTPEPERAGSGAHTFSGGMQFPEDEWRELSIGDALYDADETFGAAPEDDEPPFDLPVPEEIPAPAPKAKPAPRTIAAMPVAAPAGKKKPEPNAIADEEPYNYPPIDLLHASTPSKLKNQEQTDEEKAKTLIETLASFGISARLIGIAHGPTVTRFELSPAAGVKVSRITALSDDIALNLAAVSVRIEAPIPGKAAVGVEVPNDVVEIVPLRDVLESGEARRHPSRLAMALGRDNAGRYIVGDIAKMPHVLIAGATGAGKSVCINCLICSILYRATPDEVRLIMIDPKVVELSAYNGIPHLLVPVVTDPKKAAGALTWAVSEMTSRYKKFAELGVRDMKGYNQHRPEGEPAMPQIVIIIDELADLMMVTPGEVEDAICRLAQLARAAGIHLVIATQRPSVNVITGVIKANIPSRIAFTVASQVDSRTILDVGGAEKLLGRGDMLYAPSGTTKPLRVQGAWISDDEVHDVVEYVKNLHEVSYDEDLKEQIEQADLSDAEKEETLSEFDELLPQAVEICVEAGQASISMLQRRLRVGYARAGRLIDEMAARGVISQAEGAKPRNVLMTREQFRMTFDE